VDTAARRSLTGRIDDGTSATSTSWKPTMVRAPPVPSDQEHGVAPGRHERDDCEETHMDVNEVKTVTVLGGTGPQGRGLAVRLARAGIDVVVGSRDGSRAEQVATGLATRAGGGVRGATNAEAAATGDVVLVVVPFDGHAALLRDLEPQLVGKIVVDCVNPLGFDKLGAFALDVAEGSATQQAAAILPRSRVVGAFHNVSAVLLEDDALPTVDTDVLVLGDDREATDLVQALVDLLPGMRGVYAGRLRNARQVEALTANLISINRRYKAHAGIRVTDV
jgi:NADPH-dependent F420 reductase